jgi:hypothetical protein
MYCTISKRTIDAAVVVVVVLRLLHLLFLHHHLHVHLLFVAPPGRARMKQRASKRSKACVHRERLPVNVRLGFIDRSRSLARDA